MDKRTRNKGDGCRTVNRLDSEREYQVRRWLEDRLVVVRDMDRLAIQRLIADADQGGLDYAVSWPTIWRLLKSMGVAKLKRAKRVRREPVPVTRDEDQRQDLTLEAQAAALDMLERRVAALEDQLGRPRQLALVNR